MFVSIGLQGSWRACACSVQSKWNQHLGIYLQCILAQSEHVCLVSSDLLHIHLALAGVLTVIVDYHTAGDISMCQKHVKQGVLAGASDADADQCLRLYITADARRPC